MIKIEDLSQKRQKDLADTIKYNEPWMSDGWAFQHAVGALQQDSIENWEKYGFGALKKFKWAYQNGVNYYNTHKMEIETYLRDLTMKEREEKGWFKDEKPNYSEEQLQPTKTEIRAQKKEQDKVDKLVQKMLYGAGDEGWTKEWYEKIRKAYKENMLTITGNKEDVNLILARDCEEEDLEDIERLILFMYAHPKKVVYVSKDKMATVLSPEWHKLTDFRHIDEVYKNYPSEYMRWVSKGIVPMNKRVDI